MALDAPLATARASRATLLFYYSGPGPWMTGDSQGQKDNKVQLGDDT